MHTRANVVSQLVSRDSRGIPATWGGGELLLKGEQRSVDILTGSRGVAYGETPVPRLAQFWCFTNVVASIQSKNSLASDRLPWRVYGKIDHIDYKDCSFVKRKSR